MHLTNIVKTIHSMTERSVTPSQCGSSRSPDAFLSPLALHVFLGRKHNRIIFNLRSAKAYCDLLIRSCTVHAALAFCAHKAKVHVMSPRLRRGALWGPSSIAFSMDPLLFLLRSSCHGFLAFQLLLLFTLRLSSGQLGLHLCFPYGWNRFVSDRILVVLTRYAQ